MRATTTQDFPAVQKIIILSIIIPRFSAETVLEVGFVTKDWTSYHELYDSLI